MLGNVTNKWASLMKKVLEIKKNLGPYFIKITWQTGNTFKNIVLFKTWSSIISGCSSAHLLFYHKTGRSDWTKQETNDGYGFFVLRLIWFGYFFLYSIIDLKYKLFKGWIILYANYCLHTVRVW